MIDYEYFEGYNPSTRAHDNNMFLPGHGLTSGQAPNPHQSAFVQFLNSIAHALRWLVPDQRGSVPQYVTFYLFALVVIYAVIQGCRHATVISPFQVPPPDKFPFGERTMANALRDSFAVIRNEAEEGLRERSGELIGVGPPELAGLKLPEFPRFEVPSPFTLEVKGFSHEALISLARRIFGRERLISGDALVDTAGFLLIARSQKEGPWKAGPQPLSPQGLSLACQELALKILGDLDPTLAAAHEIAQEKYEAAYQRLRKLVSHE